MSKNGVTQCGIRESSQHRDLDCRHGVSCSNSKGCKAEDAVAFSINEGFHEAALGNSHKVSQMTEFHFRPIYPVGIIIQATRYFRRICFAGKFYQNKKRNKLWKTPDTKSGSRRTMPPYFSLTIKLGCSLASGTSR